jgi:cytochrome c oxidase subunit 1
MGFAQFLLLANFFYSAFYGPPCGRNPWNANSLEWTAPSPPGHGNFDIPPVCFRGPYEYSSPLSGDRDFLPQNEYLPPPKPGDLSGAPAH